MSYEFTREESLRAGDIGREVRTMKREQRTRQAIVYTDEGHTVKWIARQLGVDESSVRSYLRSSGYQRTLGGRWRPIK